MFCEPFPDLTYLIFTKYVPSLLYYSHIPTALLALLFGGYVFWKNRTIISGLLFLISILFAIWNIIDLIIWTDPDSRIIMFLWSTVYLFQTLILASTWYFTRVFLEGDDVDFRKKISMLAVLTPLVLFLPTSWNLTGFDLINCEARQGILVYYFYVFQVIVLLWTFGYLFKKYREAKEDIVEKKKIAIFSLGILCFLIAFSWGTVFGSITLQWGMEQYGLFGMPVFIGFLAYLIVRYQAFDIKLVGAQALTVAQFMLIGSMLFFAKSDVNRVLTVLTLLLTTGAGWFLIRSVKKEVARKEELQHMSDRLAIANQELKRLDNAKSEFISIASHQLRTPLTAIKGYTSLILEGNYGKIESQFEDVINKVYIANNRLIDLVENLLSISRLESGRMQYNFQPTQLAEVLKDAVSMFVVMAKKRGLDLVVVLPEKPLPLISVDAGKMREVISNLIDNAIKYTEHGSVTVSLKQVDDKLRFSVKDTGIGVSKEDIQHLFMKFARSKETEKLYVGGTGLGLYVGRTFVEKHGGKLWVESAGHGHGSEFIFELPISREEV